jgi:anti-sigma factor ChrR (cupin superfamily)
VLVPAAAAIVQTETEPRPAAARFGAGGSPLDEPLTMILHADFSRRATVPAQAHHWVPSPQPGVLRMMLDRLGGEHARATSLVRYAPGSVFPPHSHPGGEEILVLDGTFSDASGSYGPGWYLRNPPGSGHQPASAEGALIFVKLWQMAGADTHTVRTDTSNPAAWQPSAEGDVCQLYASALEHVALLRLAPGQAWTPDTRGGAEVLVIDGELADDTTVLVRGSWLRLPPGDTTRLAAGPVGGTVYVKTGHLAALCA